MNRWVAAAVSVVSGAGFSSSRGEGPVPFEMEVLASYENPPPYQVDFPLSIAIADIDNDGLLDFASVGAGTFETDPPAGIDYIAWFRNNGAASPSFIHFLVSFTGAQPASVALADVDDDGDTDMVVGFKGDNELPRDGTLSWFESNGGSPPTFTPHDIKTGIDCRAVAATDLNGDGNDDILVGYEYRSLNPGNKLVWYPVPFDDAMDERLIDDTLNGRMYYVLGADLDGDNDKEAVAALNDLGDIVWYPNDGGIFHASEKETLADNIPGVIGMDAADLDGDSHIDIVSAGQSEGKVAWHRNELHLDPPIFEEILLSEWLPNHQPPEERDPFAGNASRSSRPTWTVTATRTSSWPPPV